MTVGRAHFAHERIAYKVSFKENWFVVIHIPLILSYWHRFVYPAVPELLRRNSTDTRYRDQHGRNNVH